MCGIAGILLPSNTSDPARLASVEAMTATLYHRGPDGDGFWIDPHAGIAFGHRRLAIVDLTDAGRQPMLSHDGRFVVTYNGEIYNAPQLRPGLEDAGHHFRGHSDTEVMLAAFESLGVERALPSLAGMFAIGLWDREDRALHLVRDRLGKKPLYIAPVAGALLFASELRALRAFPGFDPAVDAASLALLLQQGSIPDHHCIWKDVLKLPPGSILTVTPADLVGCSAATLHRHISTWWSLAEVAESGQADLLQLNEAEAADELDRLLRLAVSERMIADVPLGAFLSGGIDSSSIVALMQAHAARPARTFTIGFAESQFDEADSARLIAQHLGTDHTEFRVTPADAYEVIPRLPDVWDEPFADESQIPTFLVARLARQHVTVALTGDGGDECFGGYTRHSVHAQLGPLLNAPLRLRRVAASLLGALSPDALNSLISSLPLSRNLRGRLSKSGLQKIVSVLNATEEADLYRRLITVNAEPAALLPAAIKPERLPVLPDPVSRMIYRDMAGYLPGDILVKADRATMAVSLEARCPLLDHRIVEFSWRLPSSFKVRGGRGKWLLRRVLARYVPEPMFERPKHGFNVPVGAWLRGPLRDWAQDLLSGPRIRAQGCLDPKSVQSCLSEHLTGRRDRGQELWALLMLSAWLDATEKLERRVNSDGVVLAALAAQSNPRVALDAMIGHG